MGGVEVDMIFDEAGDEKIAVIIAFLHPNRAAVGESLVVDFFCKNICF